MTRNRGYSAIPKRPHPGAQIPRSRCRLRLNFPIAGRGRGLEVEFLRGRGWSSRAGYR
jgi:hypothetical protein